MRFIIALTFIVAVLSHDHKDVKNEHHMPHRFRDADRMGLSNPAIRFCQKAGFQSKQLKTKQGQIPVCEIAEGKMLDAWKLFRQVKLNQGEVNLSYIGVDDEGNVMKGEKITLEELKELFQTKTMEEVVKELEEERAERRKMRDSEREERIREREERRKQREVSDDKERLRRKQVWEERKMKIEKEREERRKHREEKLGEQEPIAEK